MREIQAAPRKGLLFVTVVILITSVIGATSLSTAGVNSSAPTHSSDPAASRVIDPSSSVIPNGDFEDTRMSGVGANSYPVGGWTGGAKNSSDDMPTFSNDSYLHSWSWQQSLNGTVDSWKWIGYDFYITVPDYTAFALKEVSGTSGGNLVNVLFEDHGQSPVRRLVYEFSTNLTQVRPDGWDGYAYSYVYHEKVDLGTWNFRIKDWKSDWQNKLGYAPVMHSYWRIALSVDSFGIGSPMVARFDAVWLGNSIPNLTNGGFEDTGIRGSGENASPEYWDSWIRNPGEGGLMSFSPESYSGSWSYEVATVPVLHAFKGIYQDIGTNPPDSISFAIYGVTLPTDNNLINVRINDITDSKELSYEFSTGSGRIHLEWNTYKVARHEEIQAGIWYYRIWSTWKSDWNSRYLSGPDMSHNWRVVLLAENYYTNVNMTARYDTVSIGDLPNNNIFVSYRVSHTYGNQDLASMFGEYCRYQYGLDYGYWLNGSLLVFTRTNDAKERWFFEPPYIWVDQPYYNYTIDGHPGSVGNNIDGIAPMQFLELRLNAAGWGGLDTWLRSNTFGYAQVQGGVAKLLCNDSSQWCWYTYAKWSDGTMRLDYLSNINYFTTHQCNWKAFYNITTGVMLNCTLDGKLQLVLEQQVGIEPIDTGGTGGTGGGGENPSFLPLLLFSASVPVVGLILTGLIVVRARKNAVEHSIQTSLNEFPVVSRDDSRGSNTHIRGNCMICNRPIYSHEDVRWCGFCGNPAHKTHLLEWQHVKGSCPICGSRLNVMDVGPGVRAPSRGRMR